MNVFSKVFGTRSQREVKRIMPLVEKTESYQSQMQQLTDEQLRDKTREYKKRLAEGETLDDLLPEAFATVREAAKRVLGMEHYRVQIIGGIILHQGRIAEMKTGEGKTLVSTLPAYLNALEGKGVHIVTVNDYLAKRDAEWMGKVHEFLGLTVGVVLNDMKPEERRAAYGCDITYVTNNELGFDYLRDNMVIYKEQLVQRDLHYCIIDEIDSVLIDEARTPLIISGQSGKSTKLYEVCDILAQQLERGEASHEMTKMAAIMGEEVIETGDFVVNEKDKIVNLTEQGIKKVEKFFNIENLADGLHQAIEAKEHVKVKRESKTLATITFQNFFNKYDKKGGMTGTALTEEKEFRDIYGMDVVEIPTNRVVQRKDLDDAVYMTKKEKFNAVVEAVKEAHAKHQPVLVGTITIETSELLSRMLKREGIPHNVLNAKFHELEAEIVAQAGQADAVTIATNMAGRGTDIKLDDVAREAGGLKIIGTERHESRRIDNQLRGRSGRQGLDGENMRDAIYKMITDIVDSMTDMCFSDDMDSSEWDLDEFNTAITPIIPIHPLTAEKVKGHKKDEIKHIVKEEAVKLYEAKEAEFPEPEQLRELERVVLLKCIDSKWMDHIDDMEMLRQGIGLMAYGQRDPVVEYKMNAFEMFNNMITSIQEDTVRMLYHVHVEQKIEREQVAKVTGTNKDDSAGPKKPVQRKEDKVYPNDPCPCGSGKKYKQCCGRKAAKI